MSTVECRIMFVQPKQTENNVTKLIACFDNSFCKCLAPGSFMFALIPCNEKCQHNSLKTQTVGGRASFMLEIYGSAFCFLRTIQGRNDDVYTKKD